MHVQDIVAVRKNRLEDFQVLFAADRACVRQRARSKLIIKAVNVEHIEILIRIDGLSVDRVRHADQGITVLFGKFGGDIAIGIGKQFQHRGLLIPKS